MIFFTREERLQEILTMVEGSSHSTIPDLARDLTLSASHLRHLFKARTGSRLGRRLVEVKLRRAALLLLESDLSIKEIAYLVGYRHPSSFVRAFEDLFHQSPGDHRQEMLIERRFG